MQPVERLMALNDTTPGAGWFPCSLTFAKSKRQTWLLTFFLCDEPGKSNCESFDAGTRKKVTLFKAKFSHNLDSTAGLSGLLVLIARSRMAWQIYNGGVRRGSLEESGSGFVCPCERDSGMGLGA
jgi:hypothetical protein